MSSRRRGALRRTLLINTNLLVLFTVGSSDPGLIERHKRTQQFTSAGLDSPTPRSSGWPRIAAT
ncbi:MAG TPA: hypothetical protein VEW48_05715 [Thermoanaerobaculia bacterium]|nr:hypothetical protein [Thermoanaerobaculia bacterium]